MKKGRLETISVEASYEKAGPSPWSKWCVLAAALVVEAGGAYVLDIPSATHNELEVHFSSTGTMPFEYFFNLMYSTYSFPSIVVPLIFGRISDKFGDVILYPICNFMLLIGAAGVACGVQANSEILVLVSRAIFGIGLTGSFLLNNVLVSKWFQKEGESNHSYLALAMALLVAASRLGTAINNLVSPRLGEHVSIQFAYWFGVIICACGALCSLFISSMESKRRAYRAQASQADIELSTAPTSMRQSLWQNIRAYPLMFWLLLTLISSFYGVLAASNNVLSAYLIERLCNGECCMAGKTCPAEYKAQNTASILMNIPVVFAIVLGPLVGLGIDRLGHATLLIVSSTCLLCVEFALFTFSSAPVSVGLVFEGLSYTIFVTAAWPCVPKIVDNSMIGLAFALIASGYSIAFTVLPICVSAFRSAYTSYESVQLLFFALSCFTLCVSIYFYLVNHGKGKILR
uniref:Lysosomal dipeptide transporter MFSD1 n=1 Tax=Mucochytrium quahogii TaxID=96639 RepID=A0A7S2W3W5_9STRA|mmetsp:Transcript_13648/g.22284  ORF Transcript_13648/g.22284 Transcript_13648/m.22284 type:complete len:459 (+) Transcript_13648:166-1542(+)|eukprot:CAMPEP_0203747324 /NCGR_PEP_ID=MMETSP0098-20131031/2503_1 /ASSEMBLY_ACC=CAM_ASM_000208 /TAXON_ID=96639 /ORGANISM=" , Strain NY0313808BC1" /LENGTH=458 /DNA_ID=CAMNT_0050635711 /DNA_START=123 /DNA_END=1499 /DNA_ORIENTATION=+